MTTITLNLDDIELDGNTQLRAAINMDTVAEYADAMLEGAKLPRPLVVKAGDSHLLVDGFHRYHAHRKIGASTMDCDVMPGSQRDAVLWAAAANATHGLPRTAADKRKAVGVLLVDPEWSTWSDREIARQCKVGNRMVSEMRRSLCPGHSDAPKQGSLDSESSDSGVERKYKTKHGNESTMKVAVKAKMPVATKAAAPAPSPEPVKQAAAAAAEAALNDDGVSTDTDQEVPSVEELLQETAQLHERIEALTTGSDDKAEIAKWHRLYEDASRKQGEYGNRIADLERELRLMTKHLRDIGKLFGVDRPSKVLAAARAFVKQHRVPLA